MPVSEEYPLTRGMVFMMLIDVIMMINSLLVYIHNIGLGFIKDTLFNR